VMGVILVLFVFAVGIVYFHLHALPERFAHKKLQFEIVCVCWPHCDVHTHAYFLDSRPAACR
jgi:hypothetical protein